MIRDDLVATICNDRDAVGDDSTRLVFADWLEEHGDLPRAMFIRLQCTVARLPRWERAAIVARWEAAMLEAEHGAAWRAELPALDGVQWTELARGFVSTVRVDDVETLYRHAKAIAAAAPVSCVELVRFDERATAYPADGVPWLACVRVSHDSGSETHRHPTRSLLSATPTIEIVAHDAAHYDGALAWLDLKADGVPLKRISLIGQHTLALVCVERVIDGKRSKSLERLELGTSFLDWDSGYYNDPNLRADGATSLAKAKLAHVAVLDVSRQRLGTAGLAALVRSMPAVRELVASGCEVTDLDFLAPAGTPIVRLDLGENAFGDGGARVIASAPRLAAVESLALDTCELGAAGVTALTESPCWSTLRELDLSRNPLGLDGVIALAGAKPPPRLHTLRLADVDLSSDAAGQLAQIPWLAQLLVLELSRNELSGALLGSVAARSVQQLRLDHATLDDPYRLRPAWERALHLELRGCALGDAGLAALVTAGTSALHSLDLRECELTAASIDLLAERARCPRLHTLRLGNNPITNQGLARLLASELVQSITVLDLTGCTLTHEVAAVFAAAPRLPRLRTLEMLDNPVTHATVIELAEAESLRAVTTMKLSGHPWNIGEDDDTPEGEARADALRARLIARFGHDWWYDDGPQNEIPDYVEVPAQRRRHRADP